MEYKFQSIVIAQDADYGSGKPPTLVTVPGFVAVGTGLGYHVDLKPEEPRVLAEIIVNGEKTKLLQEEDDTRYCPTHLQSGMGLGKYWFYTEDQCRQYIQEMSMLLDWTLPLEELQKLSEWSMIGIKAKEIASKITGKVVM